MTSLATGTCMVLCRSDQRFLPVAGRITMPGPMRLATGISHSVPLAAKRADGWAPTIKTPPGLGPEARQAERDCRGYRGTGPAVKRYPGSPHIDAFERLEWLMRLLSSRYLLRPRAPGGLLSRSDTFSPACRTCAKREERQQACASFANTSTMQGTLCMLIVTQIGQKDKSRLPGSAGSTGWNHRCPDPKGPHPAGPAPLTPPPRTPSAATAPPPGPDPRPPPSAPSGP